MRTIRRRRLAVAAAAVVLSLVALLGAPEVGAQAGGQPLSLVVVQQPGTTTSDVVSSLDDAGVDVVRSTTLHHLSSTAVVVDSDDGGRAIAALASEPGVASVQIDPKVHAAAVVPNDPAWQYQSGIAAMGIQDAWSTTTGSPSMVVAVIDTGVDTSTELSGRVLQGTNLLDDSSDTTDDNGHGSMVATVIAAAGNNGTGMAGACWSCRILPIKALDSTGAGDASTVANAITYAVDHGAKVINLSLGGPDDIPPLDAAVAYAVAHDVVVVAAAGNESSINPDYPAASPGVLSVAGIDPDQTIDAGSNRGPWVDVAAPWCNVADGRDVLIGFCGTSSSTPVVAGIAALLRSSSPAVTAARTENALTSTAHALPRPGDVVHGVVDAAAAMRAVTTLAVLSPPPPDTVAPSGSIVAPAGLMADTVTTQLDIGDDRGPAVVQLFVDGTPVGAAGGSGRVGITWSTRWHPDGGVTLQALLTDGSGNQSWTAPVGGKIDNTAPGLLIVGPHNGTRIGSSYSVYLGALDANGIRITLVAANGHIIGGAPSGGIFRFPANAGRGGRIQIVAASMDNAGHIGFSNIVVVIAPARRR